MPPQLLILDDFKISNEITAGLLKEMGYTAYTCQRSEEALNLIKSIKIDIIITDYLMPEMNGLEFLKKVRELEEYQSVPVIFLSSVSNPEIIESAENFGITAWLKKPVDIHQLAEVINKLITK
ncbi:MAG: response regulator [Bacteroidales bacterium]|nr:response regulator [Bacteroidales bacterium]